MNEIIGLFKRISTKYNTNDNFKFDFTSSGRIELKPSTYSTNLVIDYVSFFTFFTLTEYAKEKYTKQECKERLEYFLTAGKNFIDAIDDTFTLFDKHVLEVFVSDWIEHKTEGIEEDLRKGINQAVENVLYDKVPVNEGVDGFLKLSKKHKIDLISIIVSEKSVNEIIAEV